MGREELTLSVTAGQLWERVHRAIADALAHLHSGPHRFLLGGGTALAARWKHRDSFDLNLAVGSDVPLRDLGEPGSVFRQTMADLGDTATYHARQWVIEFDAGDVDIVQLRPIPPGAEHDPEALAAAVNCHSRYDTGVTALTLENADATLERDARVQLVGAGEIDNPTTLGTQAGAALRGAVYRDVAIWTEGEEAVVECRTYSGAAHRTAIAPGDIDLALDESGVGHHLRASAFGARRIREALHDACRTGVGRQWVWKTGMDPPAVTDRGHGRTHEPDR